MRLATFTAVNASPHSSEHNLRLDIPKYLIDKNAKNEYIIYYSDAEFRKLAPIKYKAIKKQKMQLKQKASLIKEVVLSICREHTAEDIKKLFLELSNIYGGHFLIEIAIHRDEGHFLKDEIPYYPSTHIFLKGQNWYIIPLEKYLDENFIGSEKDATEKVDINTFNTIHNYHAHVKYSMFNLNTGITGRMSKGEVGIHRLKYVAEFLGLKYEPKNYKQPRIPVHLIKTIYNKERGSQIEISSLKNRINVMKEKNLKIAYANELQVSDLQSSLRKKKELLSFINDAINSVIPIKSYHINVRDEILLLICKYRDILEENTILRSAQHNDDNTIDNLKTQYATLKTEIITRNETIFQLSHNYDDDDLFLYISKSDFIDMDMYIDSMVGDDDVSIEIDTDEDNSFIRGYSNKR